MYEALCILLVLLNVWLIYLCYRKNSLIAVVLFAIHQNYVLVFYSLFNIEQGWWYSFEIQSDTFRNGSLLYLQLFTLPFLLLALRHRYVLRCRPQLNEKPMALAVIYLLFLCYVGTQLGFEPIGRHIKQGTYAQLAYGNYINFLNIIIRYFCIYYLITSERPYFYLLLVEFTVNVYFLDSFESFIFHIFPPLLLRHALGNSGNLFPLNKWHLAVGLIGLAIGFYVRGLSLASDTSIRLNDRLLCEGQLFWYSIGSRYEGELYPVLSAFVSNFASIANTPLQFEYGLGHFMAVVSPNVGANYVEGGTIFAFGSPAVFIFYFNLGIAWIIYLALGFLLLQFCSRYVDSLVRKSQVEFVALSLIGQYVYSLFASGDYTKINLRVVVFVGVYLVAHLLWRSQVRKSVEPVLKFGRV